MTYQMLLTARLAVPLGEPRDDLGYAQYAADVVSRVMGREIHVCAGDDIVYASTAYTNNDPIRGLDLALAMHAGAPTMVEEILDEIAGAAE